MEKSEISKKTLFTSLTKSANATMASTFHFVVGMRETPLWSSRFPRRRPEWKCHISHQRHYVDRHESGGRLLRVYRRREGKKTCSISFAELSMCPRELTIETPLECFTNFLSPLLPLSLGKRVLFLSVNLGYCVLSSLPLPYQCGRQPWKLHN